MPAQLSYPGVYVEEIPSGVHTITGVATSITAFIGRAARGPTDLAVTIESYGDFERTFGGLSAQSEMSYAVRDFFLNGGGQAIIVRVANGATSAAIDLTVSAGPPVSLLSLVASGPGAWGNNLSATIDFNVRNPADTNTFNLTIAETVSGQVVNSERFLNVSVSPADPRYLPSVLQGSNLVAPKLDANGNPVVPNARPAIGSVNATAASGADGNAPTAAQVTGSQNAKTGLYALEKADLFNLLVIAPYAANGADVDAAVWTAAAAYCEQRRAFLLIDSPSGWRTKDLAKTGIGAGVGTTSKNSALFFPRIREPDPLAEFQLADFAPSGALAGIFARTDATRGVWKAPAGLEATLVGVPQLTVQLTDAENGELNPLGVNCLRAFPVIGRVAWGARTLQGADILASEWKYIPVRRTALFLEESLYRGTQWVVFEPNDEPLWAQIRLNLGAFMQSLFRQGAFQGASPKDAYFVKCDKETTTQNDIDSGIVNIKVGFAPLKPAEFVVLQLQQMAGQIAV
jgi:phage tail sheath protein FI